MWKSIKMKRLVSCILTMVLMVSLVICSVEKPEAASKPSISLKTMSMQAGQSMTLKLSGVSGKTTWKSSGKKIATVSSKGKVTAKKAGTATITATNSGKKYKCVVTVAKKSTKTLIVYFSRTNKTKKAAGKIRSVTGGTLLRIQPKKAYPGNYDSLLKIVQKEYKNKTNPGRATKINNINQYDTIYVGYPVWLDNCPRLVQAFLKDYNLKGKTVIPFCTSGGSGIDGSMKAVRRAAKGAKVLQGRDLTDMSGSAVKKWIGSLDINTPEPQTDTDTSSNEKKDPRSIFFSNRKNKAIRTDDCREKECGSVRDNT